MESRPSHENNHHEVNSLAKGLDDIKRNKDRIDARTFDISERCRINDLLPGRCLDKSYIPAGTTHVKINATTIIARIITKV